MNKTGIALFAMTVLYGVYIAVALLLARLRDSAWLAQPRVQRRVDRFVASAGIVLPSDVDRNAVRAAKCERQ